MSWKSALKSAAPNVILEIVRARRDLAASSGSSLRSLLSACSPRIRSAIERSSFALFPLWLRQPLSFVIDIGANEGQWIESLLTLVRVQEVWVFEPNPAAMEKCRQRLANRRGIEFKEVAVGAAPGTAVLHITKASDFSSFLQPKRAFIESQYRNDPAQIVAERSVPVWPLDDLTPPGKQVDLLKIDVQGFEREVLNGAGRTLKDTAAILLEVNFRVHYEGSETFGFLHSLMIDLGFQLWSISSPYRGPSGEALWADALFVNQKKMPSTSGTDS